MEPFDKTWHLSTTDEESSITEFELQLWRAFNGFMRWVEECERVVNGTTLTGYELSVLHIIRMKERPKSITDIGKILNRSDNFNLQYSIKKLIKLGLITKIEASPSYSKSALYQITEAGIQNTEAYTQARRHILINMYIKDSNLTLSEMTKTISQLKTIYDDAAQAAAIYLSFSNKTNTPKEIKPKRKK